MKIRTKPKCKHEIHSWQCRGCFKTMCNNCALLHRNCFET